MLCEAICYIVEFHADSQTVVILCVKNIMLLQLLFFFSIFHKYVFDIWYKYLHAFVVQRKKILNYMEMQGRQRKRIVSKIVKRSKAIPLQA